MPQAERVQLLFRRVFFLFACTATFCAKQSQAQDQPRINGLAYMDYYYTFAAQDSTEGQNGFTYRRLYLSARHEFSETLSAFARLEANESSIQPFVKDLSLQWNWHPSHRLRFGIVPPPAFETTEEVWDYRSLEKTALDLFEIVSSRDMGIRADGALLGNDLLSYAVMVANNNSYRPETYRGKRMYAQLISRPAKRLVFTFGGDLGHLREPEVNTYRASALAGYVSSTFRAGIETFWHRTGVQSSEGHEQVAGASMFASGWLTSQWGLIGRFDRVSWQHTDRDGEIYATAGVAYRPHPSVRFIPNAYLTKQDEMDAVDLTGRFTVEFEF